MLEVLKQILGGQHQFASDGLLLMVIGGLGVYLRAIPLKLWFWLVGQTTMTITVKDEDAAFVWVKEWFLEQKFVRRIRSVDLDTTLRREQTALIPAEGRHWFWYAGRPFRVDFQARGMADLQNVRTKAKFSEKIRGRCCGMPRA